VKLGANGMLVYYSSVSEKIESGERDGLTVRYGVERRPLSIVKCQ
jgi:hypothetical protein